MISDKGDLGKIVHSGRKIIKILTFVNDIIDSNHKKPKRKSFSESVKTQVLLNQLFTCKKCYRFLDVYEFDHIDDDRSNNKASNCQALCPTCHAKKSRKHN